MLPGPDPPGPGKQVGYRENHVLLLPGSPCRQALTIATHKMSH